MVEYVYEGHSKVQCTVCGREHEVFFTGDDNFSPVESINMVLLEEGWEVGRMVCPDCYASGDYIDEKKMLDEMEEEWLDEYDDWDEEDWEEED